MSTAALRHRLKTNQTPPQHDASNLRLPSKETELADVRIAMPETAEFLQADLSQDPSKDLDVAERGGRPSGS